MARLLFDSPVGLARLAALRATSRLQHSRAWGTHQRHRSNTITTIYHHLLYYHIQLSGECQQGLPRENAPHARGVGSLVFASKRYVTVTATAPVKLGLLSLAVTSRDRMLPLNTFLRSSAWKPIGSATCAPRPPRMLAARRLSARRDRSQHARALRHQQLPTH